MALEDAFTKMLTVIEHYRHLAPFEIFIASEGPGDDPEYHVKLACSAEQSYYTVNEREATVQEVLNCLEPFYFGGLAENQRALQERGIKAGVYEQFKEGIAQVVCDKEYERLERLLGERNGQ